MASLDSRVFPQFQSLPVEIQDQIWDRAIRPLPTEHHVQEFIVVDHYFDKVQESEKSQADFIRFKRPSYPGEVDFSLAVPRNTSQRGPNNSGYLLDSGLWRACWASRQAMKRYFHKNEWWSDFVTECSDLLPGRNAFEGQLDVSHTASYFDAKGVLNHITIRPDTDLTYFVGVDPVLEMDWFYHYAGDKTLLDRRLVDPDTRPSFLGLDVAFKFETRWAQFPAGGIIDMIEVIHDFTGRNLWFVDYRLQRRVVSNKSGDQQEGTCKESSGSAVETDARRKVFYGRGYRLIEVRETDMSQWEIHDDEDKMQSVHEWFRRLIPADNGRLEIEGSDRMGVLAHEATP